MFNNIKKIFKALKMKLQNYVILLSICVVKCLAMTRSELEDFSNFLEMTSQLDLNVKSHGPDDEYDDDEPVSDHAWEESGKFEGDLILNERQRRLLVADIAEGLSRNGLQDSTKRWPNNEVIYYIQKEHFSSGQVQAIQDGIDDLAQASCVKFTPYTKGDRDAVVIQGSRRGCFSQVGYQGGYQVLNLSGRHPVGRGCFRHGTVVHELLHALGFYHMQSSPDRDDYIDVLWHNIVQPARHNFRKYNSFAVSDFGVGYDYESVLHYSRKAFSANGQDTLVPKQSGAEIGQRVGLSQKDIQKLNRMYCDADSNDSINNDDDSTQKKPITTKKNTKNKPFEGHGIGYHQGKTVVIKIKPTVELYRLPALPKSHMFHYFSKAPQAMSSTPNQGRGSEKKMTHGSTQSTSVGEHIPSINALITQSEIDVREDHREKANDIGTLTLAGEDDKGVRLVNNEGNNKDTTFPREKDSYEFSDDTDDETHQYHPLFPPYKKISGINSYTYPANTHFNMDYAKYYNPEKENKKHPEIVKIDKLYSSSKLQVPGYDSREVSQYENVPMEFRGYLKNQSLMENNFGKTFLNEKYFNPEESKMSGIESSSKYLSGESSNNDKEDTGYTMLTFPLKEDYRRRFTEDQDKRNHKKNYSAESYTYDPEQE